MRRYWILILLFVLLAVPAVSVAQVSYRKKLSATTLQFIQERDGNAVLPSLKERKPLNLSASNNAINTAKEDRKFFQRQIAEVTTVSGTRVVSAFIGLSDKNVAPLLALGVEIQSDFGGLFTVAIPVDKIEAVAALQNVTVVDVAQVLEPQTDEARIQTRALDAISSSEVAKALGVTRKYTGKGVILAVIDKGIDFQHIAFKDKNGNSRIVRAYTLANSSGAIKVHATAEEIAALTCDTESGSHGTHTSSTAGGSSVIIDGDNVTVSDNHTSATYGGMAPEADLVLCGLSSLYTSAIGNAIKAICDYADAVGKPCVISLSLGSQWGMHDGTGAMALITKKYAGDNHIIVYASSNDAGRANKYVEMGLSKGGGMYASAVATSAKPFVADIKRGAEGYSDNAWIPYPTIMVAARTPDIPISLRFMIMRSNNASVLYTSPAYSISEPIDTTLNIQTDTLGIAKYYNALYSNLYSSSDTKTIRIIGAQDPYSGKYYFQIFCPCFMPKNVTVSGGVWINSERFCISVSPTDNSASTIIDAWDTEYCFFGKDLTYNSSKYSFALGSDSCSVSENSCYPNVISVGAHVTKNLIHTYKDEDLDVSASYSPIGNHAYFSSWQGEGCGPTGKALPTISAPGASIVAAVNHFSADYMEDQSYSSGYARVNTSTDYPYGSMCGTSMATPCVSGIIALWLQACNDVGKTANPDYIKEVMSASAIHDDFTSGIQGDGAATFGPNGKIDALAGIKYIIGGKLSPYLSANPTELDFEGFATLEYSKTLSLKGRYLESDVTVTLNDPAGIYSIDKSNISLTEAEEGTEITVTYAPTEAGNSTATLTFSTAEADDVVVTLSGTAAPATPTIFASPESLTFSSVLDEEQAKTVTISGRFLRSNVNVSLIDPNNVFSVSHTRLAMDKVNDGSAELTIKFLSDIDGTYTGSVQLSAADAETVTISLQGVTTKEGRAESAYLNLEKYFSIDATGWSTELVENLYRYTEDKDNAVAWLTMPVYATQLSETEDTQGWISYETKNAGVATTWEPTDVFQGSEAYFAAGQTARARGTTSITNSTRYKSFFFITGCTSVRAYGKNSRNTSTYPCFVSIWECTRNDDGTLAFNPTSLSEGEIYRTLYVPYSPSITESFGEEDKEFVISISGLSADKIYKVGLTSSRGYFYETAFGMPISISTGVETPSENLVNGPDEWFTLKGLRLKGMPTERGLYIYKGRVVLVKGE